MLTIVDMDLKPHNIPIVARAGQTIEQLDIDAANAPAILIQDDDVTVKNCRIRHYPGSPGVLVNGANNFVLRSLEIIMEGESEPPHNSTNIHVIGSQGTIGFCRLTRGNGGIYALNSALTVSMIEGLAGFGPGRREGDRGQLVQFDKTQGSISDFYGYWPLGMLAGDCISLFKCRNVLVQRGLLVGNHSPVGVGVMDEQGSNNRITDVDALNQCNGAFSTLSKDTLFLRCRTRDNNTDCDPTSGGNTFTALIGSSGGRLEECEYFNIARPPENPTDYNTYCWRADLWDVIDVAEVDFVPRKPINLRFPWECPKEIPTGDLDFMQRTAQNMLKLIEFYRNGNP